MEASSPLQEMTSQDLISQENQDQAIIASSSAKAEEEESDDDDDEPFIYSSSQPQPNLTPSNPETLPTPSPPPSLPSIPIDHSLLSTLSSQGPLSSLEEFFSNLTSPSEVWTPISNFALANEPNPHSGLGLTPLHYAAKCGKVDICKWLVGKGAMVGLEDGEGEVSLMS